MSKVFLIGLVVLSLACSDKKVITKEKMMFADTSRNGEPFAKDPHVIKLNGQYFIYYSIPPYPEEKSEIQGWGIGIATSDDLIHWEKVGEVVPEFEYEKKGLCAPGALVRNDTVFMFYQTYGNWEKDAICAAYSTDGISFTKNATNPIFRPSGDWTVGRAIDAEVIKYKGRYMLYFATRDTTFQIQWQGVAMASGNSFDRDEWKQLTNEPILKPEYPWEGKCVEGASVIQQGDSLYMFYAGAYNNQPQQVGVAVSSDGVKWRKLSNKPFLANGDPGTWNSSESGHPHIFRDDNGKTYLFFQGNNDNGKSWYITNIEIKWNKKGPFLPQD